ncbi:hypothetical protein JI664_12055 [Rhodobacter sp. NTK016B]|nr:hypothetical protein [Rhodobacter sp. NTK016B]
MALTALARGGIAALAVSVLFAVPVAAQQSMQAVSQVVAGSQHTCALREDGSLWCWGANAHGQLGIVRYGYDEYRATPTEVPGFRNLVPVSQLSAGSFHNCAVMINERIYCWGWNGNRALGRETPQVIPWPVRLQGFWSVAAVAAGNLSTCVLNEWGGVRCIGSNAWGALGRTDVSLTGWSIEPGRVIWLGRMQSIYASGSFNCAINAWNIARCWGSNDLGELGRDPSLGRRNPTHVRIDDLGPVSMLGLGGSFGCGLSESGRVRCWGDNSRGQLGDGSVETSYSPVDVIGLPPISAIAVGGLHACALDFSGSVWCWGDNIDGQTGLPYEEGVIVPEPVLVGTEQSFVSIVAGSNHNCGLTAGGELYCWGSNRERQLGVGERYRGTNIPQQVIFPTATD